MTTSFHEVRVGEARGEGRSIAGGDWFGWESVQPALYSVSVFISELYGMAFVSDELELHGVTFHGHFFFLGRLFLTFDSFYPICDPLFSRESFR